MNNPSTEARQEQTAQALCDHISRRLGSRYPGRLDRKDEDDFKVFVRLQMALLETGAECAGGLTE